VDAMDAKLFKGDVLTGKVGASDRGDGANNASKGNSSKSY